MLLIKRVSQIFFVSLFFISIANAANSITVKNAWSPEAPPVAKIMAGYMKIQNPTNKDIKIISAKSPFFKRVEIHLTEMKNGMMSMIKQENLNIKSKSHIELKPGGLHMMLMGKLKPIQAGSSIPVTLTLNNGKKVTIKLKVKIDAEPEMMNHQHHHHH